MVILTLRPADKAREDAARWSAAGHAVLAAPMLHIVPVAGPLATWAETATAPPAAVLATSAAAFAGGVPDVLLRSPALCVGAATAAAARAAGFSEVASAGGDVAALAALVRERFPGAASGAGDPTGSTVAPALLYLAGRDRVGDLAGELLRAGLPVTTVVTYAAEMAQALPEAARAALSAGAVDVVVVASARSARAFADCLDRAGLGYRLGRLTVAAISAAAAAPLAGAGRIAVAAAPDGESLDRLVVALGRAVPNDGAAGGDTGSDTGSPDTGTTGGAPG